MKKMDVEGIVSTHISKNVNSFPNKSAANKPVSNPEPQFNIYTAVALNPIDRDESSGPTTRLRNSTVVAIRSNAAVRGR